MFPLNTEHQVNTRDAEKYKVKFVSTGRLMDSAIPQLQRALNEDAKSKSKWFNVYRVAVCIPSGDGWPRSNSLPLTIYIYIC